MADRWASAGVMAGHPNDISPLSLRNLPFTLFMTGQYNSEQNKLAARVWVQSLEQCSKNDFSGGYLYWVKIGNTEGQKQNPFAWMSKYTRNPWPTRIVWHHQTNVMHKRFYWISLPFPEQVKKTKRLLLK
jgi:hypothetical protein